jgi:hypothetical protein
MIRCRYVILHHTGIDEPHYDVMVEAEPDGPLTTWRSERWPIDRPTSLTRLGDHRRDYLTYEGEVSGGRGRVTRVAGGTCAITSPSEVQRIVSFDADANLRPLSLVETAAPRWLALPLGDA